MNRAPGGPGPELQPGLRRWIVAQLWLLAVMGGATLFLAVQIPKLARRSEQFRGEAVLAEQRFATYTASVDQAQLGFMAFANGWYDVAAASADSALALASGNALALALRGELSLRRGAVEASIQDLSRAVALNPELVTPRFTLALAHLRAADTSAAVDDVQAILAADARVPGLFWLDSRLRPLTQVREINDLLSPFGPRE